MSYRYLVHHYLEDAATTHPDQVAVVDGERSLTYAELESRSNQVAHLLRSLGVAQGDRVGIYLRKSIESLVGIYATMKAGAAYVPLDPSAPTQRIGYIASNCGIRHLITGKEKKRAWSAVLEESRSAVPGIEHLLVLNAPEVAADLPGVTVHSAADADGHPVEALHLDVVAQDLAYILYTSGSTGMPKGVMLSHLACRGFVDWAVDEFDVTERDVLSSHAPLHFDLSTFDLYAAAAAAGTLVLVPPTLSVFPVEIVKFIETHEISVWYSVPSILTMVVEHAELEVGGLPSVRVMLFAGEVFPTKYLSRLMRLLPHAEFANLYGPTETNVCTYHRVPAPPPEEDPPIPIGAAIANVDTFVVGDDGEVVDPGEVGELYVRGPTVMRGYWGDLERTRERLVRDPRDPEFGDAVYTTGDLVRQGADGGYVFLGRRDNQIKSRGYRIELGDIESAINAHGDVIECAVVAVPDELVTNRIHAYVAVSSEISEAVLVAFCAERIPKYMVPERFVFHGELPEDLNRQDRPADPHRRSRRHLRSVGPVRWLRRFEGVRRECRRSPKVGQCGDDVPGDEFGRSGGVDIDDRNVQQIAEVLDRSFEGAQPTGGFDFVHRGDRPR